MKVQNKETNIQQKGAKNSYYNVHVIDENQTKQESNQVNKIDYNNGLPLVALLNNLFENGSVLQTKCKAICDSSINSKKTRLNVQSHYWQFSAINLKKCYNLVLSYLNTKYLKLEDPTPQQIIEQLQIHFKDDFWKKLYQSFQFLVWKKFNFVFVQQNEVLKIVHLQFMHQNITRSFKPKNGQLDDEIYQIKTIRKYTNITKQKNETLSINLVTGEIVTQFRKFPIIFAFSEYQKFLNVIMQQIQKKRKDPKYIELNTQPLGIQIQVKYYNNEWLLSTKSSIRVNDQKDRSQVTLYEQFIKLLSMYNICIDDLNKKFIYTFYFVSSNWLPLPVNDKLYLNSVFDTENKMSAKDEKLEQSELPKLSKTFIKLNGDFQTKRQQINDVLQTLLYSYSKYEPHFSIIVKFSKQLYEIQSEVANIFRLLNEQIRNLNKLNISNDEYCQIVDYELKSLKSRFPDNKYIQFIKQE